MDDVSPAILSLTSLPDDPGALKSIIATISREREQATREREQAQRDRDEQRRRAEQLQQQLQQQIELARQRQQELELEKLRLEFELAKAHRRIYGPRADQVDLGQLLLDFGQALEKRPLDAAATAEAAAQDIANQAAAAKDGANEEKPSRRVRRGARGRRNLAAFDKLPITQKTHDLPEDEKPCPCCGQMRCKIGQERTWQIEYIPGHFMRIEHLQIKYACAACEHNAQNPQITLAEKPAADCPIDKGMAGPGLLAYVITAKYADYLPLYRLENIFDRAGFEVARSTQCLWCGDVAEIVKPVYDLMCLRVKQSHVIGTDDTVLPQLNPGTVIKARMWGYLGDEANPYNVFDFTASRERDGPALWLKNFSGVVVADAYGGYDGICLENSATKAGCWAHARRKFVDAEHFSPDIAQKALALIGPLFAIEREAKERNLSLQDRLALRQSRSLPILGQIHTKLLLWKDQLIPKHPMRQAVGYLLNQWETLLVFSRDGAVPIDNNLSEQEMKRIALMRKNSLFVGSPRGGRTAAILASITSTCRRHEVDPQLYLTQLLSNLSTTPTSQLATWLPDQWKLRMAKESAAPATESSLARRE
jgi:transposase